MQEVRPDVQVELIRHTNRAISEALTSLHERQPLPPSHGALFCLGTHIANAWCAIETLWTNRENADKFESLQNPIAALGRVLYEAYLQALYVAHDPAKADMLGRDYLDFEHVERYNGIKHILRGKSALATRLASSPMRSTNERLIRDDYDRVAPRFETKNGGIRKHWYSTDLANLARIVGREDEHRFYCSLTNSSVHAGALATKRGPQGPFGLQPLWTASGHVLELAKLLQDFCKLTLSDGANDSINRLSEDVVNCEFAAQRK